MNEASTPHSMQDQFRLIRAALKPRPLRGTQTAALAAIDSLEEQVETERAEREYTQRRLRAMCDAFDMQGQAVESSPPYQRLLERLEAERRWKKQAMDDSNALKRRLASTKEQLEAAQFNKQVSGWGAAERASRAADENFRRVKELEEQYAALQTNFNTACERYEDDHRGLLEQYEIAHKALKDIAAWDSSQPITVEDGRRRWQLAIYALAELDGGSNSARERP
jgi:uncharacterized small protein (DUF1192 family)